MASITSGGALARVLRLELEAVVATGVVRGGNDDGAARVLLEDSVAGYGGARGGFEQVGLNLVCGGNLSHRRREVLRGKARVVADHDAATGKPHVLQVACDALSAGAHVFERVLRADDRAPAVGAKANAGTGHSVPSRFNLRSRPAPGVRLGPGVRPGRRERRLRARRFRSRRRRRQSSLRRGCCRG